MRPTHLHLGWLIAASAVGAQSPDPLPRRAFIGVLARNETPNVVVQSVFAGSTAEGLGLREGDRLLRIAGRPLETVADLTPAVGARRAGEPIEIVAVRARDTLRLRGALRAMPLEEMPGAVVTYDAVRHPAGHRLRTILVRPAGVDRPPVLLYLPGLGCSSLERPLPGANDAQLRLWRGLVDAGYAVMRVEKSGVGDSEGPPCTEIGFNEEREGFRAALTSLRQDPTIDSSRIVLFGFSMGGVLAPQLADESVAGIVVFGTIARNFFEYMVENGRRQMPRDGRSPVEAEAWSQRTTAALAHMIFDRLTPAEVWARHPDLRGYPPVADSTHFHGRHARFFHELQEINLAEAWTRVRAPVLVLHGEYDWVSSRADHEAVARITGGTMVELKGMDHGLTVHTTIEASYRAYTRGAPSDAVLAATVGWLRRTLGATRGDR